MPNYFLTNLQIEGFRGINNEGEPLQVSFRTDSVNSIFAANAQGKSSIFEALCFAIKGYVPKLAFLQRSEQADSYYVNQFHTGRVATIQLTLQPNDGSAAVQIRIQRLSDGSRTVDSPSGHPNPAELLSSLNSEFCLVDYRTFLKFVEDSPLNRGRAFSALLGLGPISEFRQALERLADTRTLNSDLQITSLRNMHGLITQTITTNEAQLRPLFNTLTGQQLTGELDEAAIIDQATQTLRAIPLLAQHFSQATLIDSDFDTIKAMIRDAERSADQERLRQITAIIAELDPLSVDHGEDSEVSNLRSLVKQLETHLASTRGTLLRTHYQTAVNVLQSAECTDPSVCPTCETKHTESLLPKLQDKLADYTGVEDTARLIRDQWQMTIFSSRLAALFSSRNITADTTERRHYRELTVLLENGNISSVNLDELISLRTGLERQRVSALTILRTEQQRLQRELPPSLVTLTEQVGNAEQLRQRLLELRNNRSALSTIQSNLAVRDRWVRFITYASNTFAQAEVSLSTTKTLRLENDYREMYGRITNNPEVVPRLAKATGSEDLYLVLDRFYSRTNLTATPLLAESYRNALAVSIFLSAALQASSVSSFLVLDDVTSSFDAGHQFSLMELIRTRVARPGNPSGPQLIILSHDGLLEKYFDRISADTPWYHQRLQGLSPNGSLFTQAQDSNRLRSNAERLLRAGQVHQAEPLVRQYLEFRLLAIIDKVRIPVPIDFSMRDDRKMVQSCLDAINAGVTLHSRAGSLILSSTQSNALSRSLVPTLIANWVSHYATGASPSFTPYVLLGVLDTIDQVADCFKYDCNCFSVTRRRYYKTLSSKHCSC
jgi:DNA repair exonuclease SbcCD ATPase subunit